MDNLVSVIVPVYNVEKYLDRCVGSLANQTYGNLEILLIDDGSTDRSAEMCDDWAKRDSRIIVIHKANAGAGFARNSGLERASGEYFLFVDSDDYIDPTTVEKCLREAEKNKSDIVLFGRSDVRGDGTITPKPIQTDRWVFDGPQVVEEILPGLFTYEKSFGISVWGKLFDARPIREHQIRFCSERELISEDAYFILELFAHISRVSILAENLYFYYKNENSVSRKFKKEHQAQNDAFLTKSLALCEAVAYPAKVAHHVQARYHTYALVGMKQIVGSGLPQKEKAQALREVFNNRTLLGTITPEVLALDIPPSRVFWKLFAKRHYRLCFLLLWYKAHR